MRVLFGLLCLLLSVACWSQLNPPAPSSAVNFPQKNSKADPVTQQGAKVERGTFDAPIFVSSVPAPVSDADARHKEYEHHEKPTLDRWLTYSTGALAAFTLGLAIYTAKLFRATVALSQDAKTASTNQAKDAANSLGIAQRTIDLAISAQRPWVAISNPSPATPFTWEDKGGRMSINYSVTNIGGRPAFDLASEAHQVAICQNNANISEQVRTFCAQIRKKQIERGGSGEVLLPNQFLETGQGLLYFNAEIEESASNYGIDFFVPITIICVDYLDALTGVRHVTARAYGVVKINRDGTGVHRLIPTERVDIPADELGLPLYPSTGYVD